MSEQDPSQNFGTPYQALLDHCESAGLKFRSNDEDKCVFFSIGSQVATYDVTLFITENDALFQIYVGVPVSVGEENIRSLVTEFTARANHRLAIGYFDLNIDDGRLSYHVSHAMMGKPLEDEAIRLLLGTALGTVDRYFPALARVMFGGMTPSDAIYLSELDYHIAAEDLETEEKSPATPPAAKKPKKRRPHKGSQSKSSKDLPGLFDAPPKEEDGGSGTLPSA